MGFTKVFCQRLAACDCGDDLLLMISKLKLLLNFRRKFGASPSAQ